MSRYVKLVEELRNSVPNKRLMLTAADAVENTSKAYQMMAEAYEAEVTKPRWIPVTERLPEKHQWCLVVGENLYDMDFINSRGVWTIHDKAYAPIDYWMPLPQPPKGEQE